MELDQLVTGQDYAYRARRNHHVDPVRVTYLRPDRQWVFVRDEGGAERRVPRSALLASWRDVARIREIDRRHMALHEYASKLRADPDIRAHEDAIAILFSHLDDGAGAQFGTAWIEDDALERALKAAGIEERPDALSPLGFEDEGEWNLPLDAAERVARAFARAEPEAARAALAESIAFTDDLPFTDDAEVRSHDLLRSWIGEPLDRVNDVVERGRKAGLSGAGQLALTMLEAGRLSPDERREVADALRKAAPAVGAFGAAGRSLHAGMIEAIEFSIAGGEIGPSGGDPGGQGLPTAV